jgi:plasmid stabilization system protein ParE
MNREVIIRPEAETEITEAFDWYEAQVPGLGSEFVLVLDATFSSMVRNPDSYPQVYKGAHRALMRRFPYSIFFVIEKTRIVVLSVFHVKRNPTVWKKRTSNKLMEPTSNKGG